jgi:hypothetical protein
MPKHPDDYKTGSVDLKVEKVVKDEKKVKESDVFGKKEKPKKSSKAKQTKRKPRPRPRPRSY